jgi:hypothetical protein
MALLQRSMKICCPWPSLNLGKRGPEQQRRGAGKDSRGAGIALFLAWVDRHLRAAPSS